MHRIWNSTHSRSSKYLKEMNECMKKQASQWARMMEGERKIKTEEGITWILFSKDLE
jgi:hypothetical protein